ncbi:MAG TPA: hypothetical protein PKD09_06785 [Aggregatilinea sp.]|uniref:hypothetical protein n=1 Tax=Aggregatilinea sp. TaxID=2806333 RepID=UPI002BF58CE7|nr:hypothetical protein [Aggregatilinea sp.]HML21332.1 hypothetical protein [Aggregatilinea sp.]
MNFQELFWQALNEQDPVSALRQMLIDLRAQGIEKEALLKELYAFRQVAASRSEEDEDNVLDVMDFLVGFCSSHMRID